MKTIGILGLGSMGMKHAANLIDMGHKVVGYDTAGECGLMLERLGGTFMEARYFENFTRDGLVIATPSKRHARDALTSFDKHILIEKPIGVCSSDVKLLSQIMLERSRNIMVGNNLRFHPGVQKVKKHLAGVRPYWARFVIAQYNDKPDYIRDGVVLNWGAHEVDLALYLLGPAVIQTASVSMLDDIADIILKHDNGCRTHIHLDYLLKRNMRGFEIMAEDKAIYGDLTEGAFIVDESEDTKGFSCEIDWNETYLREMRAFIDRIDGREDDIGANGEDGLECLRLLLTAKKFVS